MKRGPNLACLAIRGEPYIVTQLSARVICRGCITAPPTPRALDMVSTDGPSLVCALLICSPAGSRASPALVSSYVRLAGPLAQLTQQKVVGFALAWSFNGVQEHHLRRACTKRVTRPVSYLLERTNGSGDSLSGSIGNKVKAKIFASRRKQTTSR